MNRVGSAESGFEVRPAGQDGRRADRRVAFWLSALATSATLFLSEGAITGSDGRSMYEVAASFVERGSVAVDTGLGVPGTSGQSVSRYGLGLPLVAIAAYAAIRPVASLSSRSDLVAQAWVASMMPVICGLLVAALYRLSRRLGAGVRSSAFVASGALAGTFLLPYSKEFFSEPLATLLLVVGLERGTARHGGSAGLAAGGAGLTRPQAFAFAPALLWRVWRDGGWAALQRSGAALALGVMAAVGYNYARFGRPLTFGYADAGFSTPFVQGAAGLLLHPAKSIFLFAPIVVVIPLALGDLWKSNRTAFWLISWNFVVTFAIAATWESWAGGWAWGPRLLLLGVIPAVAPVARWSEYSRLRLRIVGALFALGLLISAPAMIVSTRAQQVDRPAPQVGPSVIRQYELVPPTVAFSWQHLHERGKGMNRQYVSLWQVGIISVMGTRGLAVAIGLSALMAVAVGLSALSLWRSIETYGRGSGC